MKKKILILIALIVSLGLIVFVTYNVTNYITTNRIARDYKLHYRIPAIGSEVTYFDVQSKTNRLNMFKTSFDVDVKIKGTVFDENTCLDYVHKSERMEHIDDKMVAVIEFEPVYKNAENIFELNKDKMYKTKFKYNLEAYGSGDLVYKFKCGEYEKEICVWFDK